MERSFKERSTHFFDSSNYDSIESFTPHVCRYTCAYMSLDYSFNQYMKGNKNYMSRSLSNEALFKEQEDLLVLGGWSPTRNLSIVILTSPRSLGLCNKALIKLK